MEAITSKLDDLIKMELFAVFFETMLQNKESAPVQQHALSQLIIKLNAEPFIPRVPFSAGRMYMCKIIENASVSIHTVVPEIMLYHRGDAVIQEYGCYLFLYAFNTQKMSLDAVVPCTIGICYAMNVSGRDRTHSDKIKYRALCALNAITRGPDKVALFPAIRSAGDFDVVVHVLRATHRNSSENLEHFLEVACTVLGRLAAGWRVPSAEMDQAALSRVPGAGLRKSVDRTIVEAMDQFSENEAIQIAGCAALGSLVECNFDHFTEVVQGIQLVTNLFQVAAPDAEYERVCARTLCNFCFDPLTRTIRREQQTFIGNSGNIAIALAMLKRYYDRNTNNVKHIETMCAIIDMLCLLMQGNRNLQHCMFFCNSQALLLGIVRMRRKKSIAIDLETKALELICWMNIDVFEDGSRQAGRILNTGNATAVASPNQRNKDTPAISFIEAALCAMPKRNASARMIQHCLELLVHCAQVPALRPKIGIDGLATIVLLMFPKNTRKRTAAFVCTEAVARLGMLILASMAQDKVFALDQQLQRAMEAPIHTHMADNQQHCATHTTACQRIYDHTQDSMQESDAPP